MRRQWRNLSWRKTPENCSRENPRSQVNWSTNTKKKNPHSAPSRIRTGVPRGRTGEARHHGANLTLCKDFSRRRSEHTDRNVEETNGSFQNYPNSLEIVTTWCYHKPFLYHFHHAKFQILYRPINCNNNQAKGTSSSQSVNVTLDLFIIRTLK